MARAAAVAPVRRAEPARPELTVVRRRRARRSMVTQFCVLAFIALFVSVLGVVIFQTLRAQNQTTLDDLDRQVSAEQDRGKALRLQLADAESPERIAKVAEQRLGMVPPNDVAYLQPKADDDAHTGWDPIKDPIPTTTVPTTAPPTTVATPSTLPQATTPSSTYRSPTATPTTKAPVTSPTTATPTTRPSTPPSTSRTPVTSSPGKTR